MKTNTDSSFPEDTRRALAVIFLLSVTGLTYEVILTRLFSLMFQYHYVFLIVSLAIAGLSVGAAVATRFTRKPDTLAWSDLANVATLLALLLVGATATFSLMRSASLIGVALIAATLPFAAIGFLNAVLFSRFARRGGTLYASDLLGGALGLVFALILVGWIGAYNGILALSIVAALTAFLMTGIGGEKRHRSRALGLIAVLTVGLLVNQAVGALAFFPERLKDPPPDKTMLHILQNDPRAVLTETRWDPFARVDMVETRNDSVRYVFTDAGAGSIMVRYDGDDRRVSWLRQELPFLPFTYQADALDSVLILGAGAGQDVLMARLAGAEAITAVEINPALVALTRETADYNGNILDLPEVETVVMDGRNFIENSDQAYDLIYANVVYSQAAAPGHSALAESYIFTREALQAYWNHLSEGGRIGFVTHHGIEGLRLLVAALDMLQHEGMTLQQALNHVALVTRRTGDPQTRTSVLMITRQPWTRELAANFADEAHRRGAGMLYMPILQEVGLEGMILGAITLDDYIAANSDYNYVPTTDDSPFFYQFAPGLPSGLAELLWLSGGVVFLYLSWLIFFFVRTDRTQWKRAALAPYFALLGAAFLLVEIPMIQRFNLLLGQPAVALVAVIGALLVGGGLGSLFSSRYRVERLPSLVTVFAVTTGLAVLISLVAYPALIRWAMPFALAGRLMVTLAALAPLGFLMGVCFPSGLRIAHVADPEGVAAFWGANAVTSVLGSALAMALAVSVGFSAALVLGAALYGLAAGLAHLTWPRMLT